MSECSIKLRELSARTSPYNYMYLSLLFVRVAKYSSDFEPCLFMSLHVTYMSKFDVFVNPLTPTLKLHSNTVICTLAVDGWAVLSWWIIGRPPHGVSRQWAVVVHYGMRRATGASLSSWLLKAAGLSCSITTAGSWFQSPTVMAANELRSPDETQTQTGTGQRPYGPCIQIFQ